MAFEDVITILAVLVERMVGESGEPAGFDARTWLDHWLGEAVPALGDRTPLDVLKEPGCLEAVRSLLLRSQSGVFS